MRAQFIKKELEKKWDAYGGGYCKLDFQATSETGQTYEFAILTFFNYNEQGHEEKVDITWPEGAESITMEISRNGTRITKTWTEDDCRVPGHYFFNMPLNLHRQLGDFESWPSFEVDLEIKFKNTYSAAP
ncbi:MAG: hypothetical protein WCW31_05970 [Patescibacteria group bacterium]|jgi:hypothetical protein